ncbi:hypothetical protein N9B54_03100 [Mariniblastus sp.]|nr:hypothetical protein [Mariniblastus sp.]
MGNSDHSKPSGADSGALRKQAENQTGFAPQKRILAPALAAILDAWLALPKSIRVAVTTLVRSAVGGDE